MRIAAVSPFVDRRHGTERALAEVLERLSQDRGCEIHLYAQRVDDLHVKDPRAASKSSDAQDRDEPVIYWHRVPSIGGPHLVQFLAWMLLNSWQRKWDTLFGRRHDVVLSPGINCLHPNIVIVHVLFRRLRELARETAEAGPERSGFLRGMHRRLYYGLLTRLERRVYSNPRIKLAVVSKRMANLLQKSCGREDARIVFNGVDTREFCVAERLALRSEARKRRGFREDECALLLVGNDWRVKGLPTLLEAIAARRDLPLRLMIAGSDAPDHFKAVAARLGVADCCEWETQESHIMELYAAADVYVSPSLEDSFALPVAEAMACGLPVITSRCAGVAELVDHGVDGFVMQEPRDAQALAEILGGLVSDRTLRSKIGDAAAAKALGWTWDQQANVVWELVQSAMAQSGSARRFGA